jgi:hypothetical protein
MGRSGTPSRLDGGATATSRRPAVGQRNFWRDKSSGTASRETVPGTAKARDTESHSYDAIDQNQGRYRRASWAGCGLTATGEALRTHKSRSAAGDGRVGLYAGFCPRAPPGIPVGGHPSRPAVAGGLERSTRRLGRAALERLRRTASRTSGPPPLSTLLRVGFTEPHRSPGVRWSLTPPFHPYRPRCRSSTAGGLFSVALSRGSPRVAVSDHPALWSPDVPRRRGLPRRRDRPADSSVVLSSLGSPAHHFVALPRVRTQQVQPVEATDQPVQLPPAHLSTAGRSISSTGRGGRRAPTAR